MKLTRAEMARRVRLDKSQIARKESGQPEGGPLSLVLDGLALNAGRADLTAENYVDPSRTEAAE